MDLESFGAGGWTDMVESECQGERIGFSIVALVSECRVGEVRMGGVCGWVCTGGRAGCGASGSIGSVGEGAGGMGGLWVCVGWWLWGLVWPGFERSC